MPVLPHRRRLGRLGLCEFIEPHVRRLVPDRFLSRPTSRGTAALANGEGGADTADALVLLDVAIAVERRFGISISERALGLIRTYDDLVRLTVDLVIERDVPQAESPSLCVRSCLRDRGCSLERAFVLTPYAAQLIAEDACGVGREAELEVVLPDEASDDAVAGIERAMGRPRARGVHVIVRREGTPAPARPAAPLAAGTPIEFALVIGRVVHETQNERGVCTAYVASGRRELRDAVLAQAEETDRMVAQLGAFLEGHAGRLGPLADARADAARGLLAELASMRNEIVGLQCATGTVIDYYTRINRALLTAADALVAGASEAELARLATAHLAFLHAKEEAALERAEVARAFAPAGRLETHPALLASSIAARESYLHTFATTASEDVLRAYRQQTADPAFAEAARLEQAVLAGPTQGADVAACFRAMAAKLERLRDVESCSAETLVRYSAAHGN
jgi:hypothetical protein